MEISLVAVEKPDDVNVVLGQSHFVRTVEDLFEAIVTSSPGARFGAAFCEASGPRLVRRAGTDAALTDAAARNIRAIGAGHAFLVMLAPPLFPIHVLRAIREVPEVCRIFCATANPLHVVVAEAEGGRGILGVIDGAVPLGIEGPDDVEDRKGFLRRIGLKT